jgi:hypothetical protein
VRELKRRQQRDRAAEVKRREVELEAERKRREEAVQRRQVDEAFQQQVGGGGGRLLACRAAPAEGRTASGAPPSTGQRADGSGEWAGAALLQAAGWQLPALRAHLSALPARCASRGARQPSYAPTHTHTPINLRPSPLLPPKVAALAPKVESLEGLWNRVRTISGADSPDDVLAYWRGEHGQGAWMAGWAAPGRGAGLWMQGLWLQPERSSLTQSISRYQRTPPPNPSPATGLAGPSTATTPRLSAVTLRPA